ncbi:hypothetical protein TNCV_1948361 [Trichonephila clavipes]|nr:hypothetical protein TNCV_1948361 [Trichonephila clavipes]
MIQGSQATGAPTCVTIVPLTKLSYVNKDPEGILIRAHSKLAMRVLVTYGMHAPCGTQYNSQRHSVLLHKFVNSEQMDVDKFVIYLIGRASSVLWTFAELRKI